MTEAIPPRRGLAIAGLLLSIALLIPGLIQPVLIVSGTLNPDGVADLAPKLIQQGISDKAVDAFRPMLNPMLLPIVENAPGGLKGALVNALGSQIGAQLKTAPPIEVYSQVRSIKSSIQHLYEVGSYFAATLILLFSVVVPFTKATLVMWAVFNRDVQQRTRTLHLVEMIAKWSMADVFAVALFITYLAAAATQSTPGTAAASLVSFKATFGPGFYWFAGYCLVSLAVQQATARWIMKSTRSAISD